VNTPFVCGTLTSGVGTMHGEELVETWFPWVLAILLTVCAVGTHFLMWHLRSKAVAAAGSLELRVRRPRVRAWAVGADAIFACMAVFALVILLTGQSGLWRVLPLLVMSLALISTSLLARLAGVSPRELEMRERGLLTQGTSFWPWDRVRSYQWVEDTHPTLAIQLSGYGFVRYRVQAEQRDAVDSVLRTRMPAPARDDQPQAASTRRAETDR
jgi:hypothetical protein